MQIHILRGEESTGPYTPDQVRDYYNQGTLLPTDFAYHDGLAGWVPLEQLLAELPPIVEALALAPLPQGIVHKEPEASSSVHAVTPPKANKKIQLMVAAVVGLLVLGGLAFGGWKLFKGSDPIQTAQTQIPSKPEQKVTPEPTTPEPTTPEPTTPEPTTPEPKLIEIEELNMSAATHVLLVKPDGTLWSWGRELFGEFGYGKTGGGWQEQKEPKQIGNDNDWISVEAAENQSFGIKKDGSLWAWGRNYDAFPKIIYPDHKWKSIVAHEDFLVATTTNGRIYSSSHYSSNDIKPIIGGPIWPERSRNSKWIDLTAGYRHFLGITANGDLWAWGKGRMSNHCGQMGLGNKTPPAIDLSPIKVGEDSNWASVSAKGNHSLAIKKDGTIWAWGLNAQGQVGNGSKSYDGVLAPVQVGRDNNWKNIAAGQTFSTGIKTDGTIWGWGSAYPTEPKQLSQENEWVDVCAGLKYTFALKKDRTLWLFDTSTPRGMTEPPVKILDLTSSGNASIPSENTNPTGNPNSKISLSEASKDQPFINSLGMKFVPIPSTDQFFSVYETRTSEYKKFIVESGKGYDFGSENDPTKPNHPAKSRRNKISLNYGYIGAFCGWLTERDRKLGKISGDWEYRLPTIDEWKTAAALDSVEVNNQATSDDENLKAVGSGKPNKFGLYDVAGNAWELTLDSASKSLSKMAAKVGGAPRPLAGGYTNGAEGFRCIIARVKIEGTNTESNSKKTATEPKNK